MNPPLDNARAIRILICTMTPKIIKIHRDRVIWLDSFGELRSAWLETMPRAEFEKLSDKDRTRINAYHKTRQTISNNWDTRHPKTATK